jgi:uncharacterized protein (TIGR02453 family)
MAHGWFTPALFQFLAELKENNSREWFQDNKARYERDVRDPVLAFVMAFGDPLAGLSRHFVADPRPSGGSMFRIFRDTRFAKDKSPYKTNVGAQFRHALTTRDAHAPGFYLHLEPGGCFAAAGSWHPDADALRRIRERIAARPREWQALAKAGLEVQGDTLVRVPQGFDPGHPEAASLRLKDFYTYTSLTQRQVCAPDFMEAYTEICRGNAPLMKFLAKALELPY